LQGVFSRCSSIPIDLPASRIGLSRYLMPAGLNTARGSRLEAVELSALGEGLGLSSNVGPFVCAMARELSAAAALNHGLGAPTCARLYSTHLSPPGGWSAWCLAEPPPVHGGRPRSCDGSHSKPCVSEFLTRFVDHWLYLLPSARRPYSLSGKDDREPAGRGEARPAPRCARLHVHARLSSCGISCDLICLTAPVFGHLLR